MFANNSSRTVLRIRFNNKMFVYKKKQCVLTRIIVYEHKGKLFKFICWLDSFLGKPSGRVAIKSFDFTWPIAKFIVTGNPISIYHDYINDVIIVIIKPDQCIFEIVLTEKNSQARYTFD